MLFMAFRAIEPTSGLGDGADVGVEGFAVEGAAFGFVAVGVDGVEGESEEARYAAGVVEAEAHEGE